MNDLEPGEYIVVEEDASIPGWSWSVSGEGLVSVEYFLESSMAITNVYDTPDEPDGPPPDTP